MPGSEILAAVVAEVEFGEITVAVRVSGTARNTDIPVREGIYVVACHVVLVVAHGEQEHPAHPVVLCDCPLICSASRPVALYMGGSM